jgi:hypothetical protein
VNSSEEGSRIFGIAGGDSAPTLEVQESVFNEMPNLIEIFVILSLDFTILFWRDNDVHSLIDSLIYNGIAVIPTIS